MKHDTAKLTRAASELQIGELSLECRPLTDRDIEELDNWVRKKYVETCMDAMRDLEAEQREEARDVVFSKVLDLTFMSKEGFALLKSFDGLSKLLSQMSGEKKEKIREQLSLETLASDILRTRAAFVKQNLVELDSEDDSSNGKK